MVYVLLYETVRNALDARKLMEQNSYRSPTQAAYQRSARPLRPERREHALCLPTVVDL